MTVDRSICNDIWIKIPESGLSSVSTVFLNLNTIKSLLNNI